MPKDTKLLENTNLSLFHKLAVLSLTVSCLPKVFIALSFIWSQFQLLELLAKTCILCLFEHETSSSLLPVHLIEKYLFSSNLFDPVNSPEITLGTLILALIYLAIPTLALAFILYTLHRRITVSNIVLKLWKTFVDLHSFVVFYPLHLNTSHLIVNFPQENIAMENLIKTLSYIVLIYNLILAFAFIVSFHASLKTKSPFSAKSNTLHVTDLLLKTLLPFFIYKNSLGTGEKAGLMVVISLYCFFRDQILFRILLYYQVKALKIASIAHALTSSLVLVAIFAKIFCYVHEWRQYNVTALLWVSLAPIFIKLYSTSIHKKLLKIVIHPFDVKNAYHLIHYWEIYKSFSKLHDSGLTHTRIKQEYFDFITILNPNEEAYVNTPEAHYAQKKIFFEKYIDLLKAFLTRNPHNSFPIELALARIYTKKESSCVLASHIISKNSKKNFLDKTSLALIQLRILNKLQSRLDQVNRSQEEEALQIVNFVRMIDQSKKLRIELIQNVNNHIKFWKTFSASRPDFLQMIQLAQQNTISSKDLNSISAHCKNFKKAYFPEPLLQCSVYCYFFQYDTLLAGNLLKEYFDTQKRIQELYNRPQDATRFTSEAVYLIISSTKNKLGEILDCSGSIRSAFGYPKEFLLGKSFNLFIPPVYIRNHENFIQAYFQQETNLNKTMPVPILVQEGHVKPGLINVSLIYMQDYGLCYYIVFEAIKDDTRLVLLNSHGVISNYSKNFAKDLGFQNNKDQVNIQDICPSFFQKVFAQLQPSSQEDSALMTGNEKVFIEEINELNNPQTLSFYPASYLKDKETHMSSLPGPLTYQARIRKVKVQNSEVYELKMQKSFSQNHTILPAPLKRSTFYQSAKNHDLTAETNFQTHQSILSSHRKLLRTSQTQEMVFSPRSQIPTTKRLLSMRSPTKRDNFYSKQPTLSPALGDTHDEETFIESFQEEILSSEDREGHKNIDLTPYEQQGRDLLEDIFGSANKSSTETGVSRLESTKSIERQKIAKRLTQSRNHHTENKLYIASFALVCLLLMGLLIWLNFYTSHTSENVKLYSTALQNAYFRSYWTKIANQDMLYWLGALVKWVDYDPTILIDAFSKSFHYMSYYNQALQESLSFLSEDLQAQYYEKNVRIYDRDDDHHLELVGTDDTFQATRRIVDRGMTNFQRAVTGFDFKEKINQDSYFILDNSLNDLQIRFAELIEATKNNLFAVLDDSRLTMIRFLIFIIITVVIFMIFSLKHIISTNIEFKRFMTILYTLKKPDIKHIEDVASNFKELLEKDSQERKSYFSLYDAERSLAHVKAIRSQQRDSHNNLPRRQQNDLYFNTKLDSSLQKVNLRNFVLFSGLFVFIGIAIIFAYVYYKQSSDKINTMQTQQTNLYNALKIGESLAWVTVQIQLAPLFNFTLPTRNMPIMDNILTDIEQLQGIDKLQDSLRDENGEFSAEMEAILFNVNCETLQSPGYSLDVSVLQANCKSVSNGKNTVDLLEITSRLGMSLASAVPQLYSGSKDLDTLQAFYNQVYYVYAPLIDTDFVLFISACVVVIEEFEILMTDLENLQTKLAWIAVLFTFALGVISWIFIMRKIAQLDFVNKDILSFVPVRLLLKNPQLKRYLVRTAGKDDTMAKSLLR